jgi:hypothetical protein
MDDAIRIRKTLTPNDIGATGSHQAGIHVPKGLLRYFPSLDETRANPSLWLEVNAGGGSWRWRFVHYNNGVNGTGTRDEYRLTHVRKYLAESQAAPGDVLELEPVDDGSATVTLVREREIDEDGALVLWSEGPWRTLPLRRSRAG